MSVYSYGGFLFCTVFAARTPVQGTAQTGSGILTACDWGLYCFQPQRIAACLTCRPNIVCPYRTKCMMQPATAAQPVVLARRLALCHRVVAHRLRFLRSAVLSALLIFTFQGSARGAYKSPHYPSRKNRHVDNRIHRKFIIFLKKHRFASFASEGKGREANRLVMLFTDSAICLRVV